MLLKNEGKLQGAGAGTYLASCPNVKFSQRNFKEQLANHKELRDAFSKECYEVLCTFLSDTKNRHFEENSLEDDIFNSISNMGMPAID